MRGVGTSCPLPALSTPTLLLCCFQEDAHIAHHIRDDCHIFGVFDGHGGPEVAKFCSKRMTSELQRQSAFLEGRYEQSLKQVGRRQREDLQGLPPPVPSTCRSAAAFPLSTTRSTLAGVPSHGRADAIAGGLQ